MSAKFGGGAVICRVCDKKCFQNEGVDLDPATRIHRACFRCAQCKTTLTKRFGRVGDAFYCEPHAAQLLAAADEPAAPKAAASSTSSTTESTAPAAAPEIVNRTGGIELGGRLLFGVDAETALRRLANYDLALEADCREWVEAVIGEKLPTDDGLDFGDHLKDGVVLCKLINAIQPGTVAKINTKANPLFQQENVRAFLQGCWKLGIPSASLFNVNDLYYRADLTAVLQTLLALGRAVQTLPGCEQLPQLGKINQGSGVRKFAPVSLDYLDKKFVQSFETADSQQLRTQLVKLEEQLKRERFARAVLEEQVKAGTASDAGAKLAELRAELDAVEAKRAQAASEARRLLEANQTLAAELEWEQTKQNKVTTVEIHNVEGDAPERSREELLEENANLEHAIKLLAQKRKTDVAKNRELTARLEEAAKQIDTHVARIAVLESELREARERAAASDERAASLMARLEELSRPVADELGAATPAPATPAAAAPAGASESDVRDILLTLLGAGAHQLEHKDEAVDWELDPLVDAEDVLELSLSFRSDEGRRVFLRALDDTLQHCPVREMQSRPFELLGQILQSLLSEMSRDAHIDLIGARIVMNASSQLYRQQHELADEPEFVEAHLRNHDVWKSPLLWSEAFDLELMTKLRERTPSAADGDDLPIDSDLVSNLLGVVASKMAVWGCPAGVVDPFVDDVCARTGLNEDVRAAIKQKIAVKQALAAMQAERQLRKKTRRRSRAESLLLPSSTLRRRRAGAASEPAAAAASPSPTKK